MKKNYLFLFLLMMTASFGWGQVSIYTDDFSGENGKGQIGSTNDVSGVDWSIDVSDGSFTATSDYFAVQSEVFEAQDIDGTCTWQSETFSISGYTSLEFNFDAFASGDFEASGDVFNVEIYIDAASESLFLGTVDEDEPGDPMYFGTTKLTGTLQSFTKSVSGTGSNAYILITANNNAGTESYGWDNLEITGTAAASGPQNPTAFSIDNTTSTQIGLSWTNAAESDGVWVIAREGAAPDVDITDGEGLYDYGDLSSTGNFSTATDLVDDESYSGASGNILVYSGTGTSCVVSGLTEGDDYYFTIFNEYDAQDWSDGAQADPTNDIAEVQGTSGFAAAGGNAQASLSWFNPGGQGTYWDNVLILAKSGGAVDATPSGAGSGYSANAAFGSGDEVGTANYVVYSGIGTSETVTNLSNGTTYHFKTFVYDGADWAPIGQTETDNCTPADVPVSGDIIINEIMYNSTGVDEEWIEIYNTTGSSINLTSDWELSCTNASWTYSFDGSVSIAAGDFLTIQVGSSGSFPFTPDIVRSSSSNQLVNSSATITIKYNSTTINSVTYDDGSPWPTSADGNGPSLELINVSLDNSIATNWQASYVDDGTPGSTNSTSGTAGLWKTDAATTDWFTGSNWDDGSVPTSGVDVSIPTGASNYPTITGATTAECNALTLASGSSLTIAADGSLTTNGVYSNPSGGTLTIESDGTNNGSFIPFGVSGPADIELYIVGHASVDANGWHLVSSPNTDATFDVSGSDFEPGASDDLYWWNETNYTWENYKETTFDFERGHGYLCAYNSTATKVFDGWPNAGNVTVGSLTCQNSANDDGWNLLGNPFPSDIIWNETGGDWTLSEVGGVAQVFNSGNRNYDPVAADENIASMQGFFVQVNAGQTGSVTIPASARDHGNSKWMKSNNTVESSLKLKVTGGTVPYYDQTQVKFITGATNEYDYLFDGHKLFGYLETPRLYTTSGEEMFSINSLPFSNDEKILPLSFLAGTNGDFTIEIVQNTIMAEGNTYLEDLVTGQMINLDQQSTYTFQATTNDDENRFLLHFNGVTGVEDVANESNIQVYSVDDMIYINSLEDLSADILVYNINGQLLYNGQMNGESLKRIALETSSGVYLVSVVTEETTTTHKVYVK